MASAGRRPRGAGSGSGAQLLAGMAQSPLSWVCKLQKRDVLLFHRDTGIAQHKYHTSFIRAIPDAHCILMILSSLFRVLVFPPSLFTYSHTAKYYLRV